MLIREACQEAKVVYKAFGQEDNLRIVEDDSKHWMTPKIRLAIYTFFMKYFNIPGDPSKSEAEILSKEELTVTPTGQLSTFLGGEMIFDINKKETEKLIENLEKRRQDIESHLVDVLGVGETKNTATRGLADGYTAVLIGKSIVGIQAGDIVRVVGF
jgi:hypothetical protein